MTTMTDKPNCGNCPNKGTEQCPYDVICFNEDHCDFIQPFKRSDEFMKFSMACGLLCHPGAREWLMAPVIKELEQRAINYAEQSDDADASRDLQIGFVGKSMGLRQAISLIRGDGK